MLLSNVALARTCTDAYAPPHNQTERRRIFVTFIVSGLVVTLLVSLVVLLFLVRQRSKVRDIAWPLILEGGVEVKSDMSSGEEASDSDKGSQVPGSSSE